MLILVRYLGLHDFGLFILALTVLGFGEQFITLGLTPLMITEISREVNKENFPAVKSLIYNYFRFQCFVSIFVSVLVFLLPLIIKGFLPPELFSTTQFFSLILLFNSIKNTFIVTFQGFAKLAKTAMFASIEALSRLILIFCALFFFSPTIEIVALIYVISFFVSLILIFPSFIKLVSFLFKIHRDKTGLFSRYIKKEGFFAFITHLIKNVELNVYPWIVNIFLGAEGVGLFSILLRIQSFFMRVLHPVDEVLLPLLAGLNEKEKKIKEIFWRLTKYSFIFSLIMFFFALIFSFLIIKISTTIFSPELEIAFIVLLLSVVFFGLTMPARFLLFRYREQRFITEYMIFLMAVLFFVGPALMFFFNLIGAALANMVVAMCEFLIKRRFLERKYEIKYKIRDFFVIDKTDISLVNEIKKIFLGFIQHFSFKSLKKRFN